MAVTRETDGGGGNSTTSTYEYYKKMQEAMRRAEAARKAAEAKYQQLLQQSKTSTAAAQGAQRTQQTADRYAQNQQRAAVTGSLGRSAAGSLGKESDVASLWEKFTNWMGSMSAPNQQSAYSSWNVPFGKFPSFIPPISTSAPGTVRPDYQDPLMGYQRNKVDYMNWLKMQSISPDQWVKPTANATVQTPETPGMLPSVSGGLYPATVEGQQPQGGGGYYPQYLPYYFGGGGYNINYPKSEDINRWYANMVNWRIGRPQGG